MEEEHAVLRLSKAFLRRYLAISWCWIALLHGALSWASMGQESETGQAQAMDGPKAAFTPVLAQFESTISILRQPELGDKSPYNASDVNTVITNTKANILSRIPAEDEPLKAYVKSKVPSQVDAPGAFVSRADGDARFSALRTLLSKLTNLPAFRLNLSVTTRPPKAAVDFSTAAGTRLSATSDDIITNVYRGEYAYAIRKNGYKSISATLDLVDRSGDTLTCELVTEPSTEQVLPCSFR